MSDDPVIKYATGYVKGRLSIVTLERESKSMWWVIIESKTPYKYDCDLFNWKWFAERKFWKLVDIYGLKATSFEKFDIDKEKMLIGLAKKTMQS